MIKRRKIAAFVLAFFLVIACFSGHLAWAKTETEMDTESVAQSEIEGQKEADQDSAAEGDSRDAIPESEDGFNSEQTEPAPEGVQPEETPATEQDGEPVGAAPRSLPVAPTVEALADSADVSSAIKFSEPILEFGDSTSVDETGAVFKYGYYTLSVSWEADPPDTTFNAGDYFTFTVPKEFGGFTGNKALQMVGPGGAVWGTIEIDSEGNGKATFNENVNEKQELKGIMEIKGSYWERAEGEEVKWDFTFGGKTTTYEGSSGGIKEQPNGIKNDENYKAGWSVNGGKYKWCIQLNRPQENWSGIITVEDTLGPGHKMVAYSSKNNGYGYYGDGGIEYLEIGLIDWDTMRADYNDLVAIAKEQGISTITGPSTGYTYPLTEPLTEGYSAYMWTDMLYAKQDGSYKYITPYIGGLEVKVTDGGFTIVFPDGALAGKSVQISYYTEDTAAIPQKTLTNTCTISSKDGTVVQTGDATVYGRASVEGTSGELILIKQDSEEREKLSGVEFTLVKTGGSGGNPQITDANGSITFKLTAPYAGTYTLTELEAPSGYKQANPIELTLNSDGKIIEVNGETVNGDTIISGVGHVSSDRLMLIVYNDKTDERTVSKTVTKVWAGDDNQGGLRPTSVTVRLLADGVQVGDTVTLDESKGWKHTWDKLPEKNGEDTIIYTVKEVSVPAGYEAEYSPDTFTITNRLQQKPEPVEVRFTGTKTLTGKNLTDDMFKFEVRDGSGTVVSTGTNKADGKIVFDAIPFSEAGTYTYTVSEKNDGQDGIIYDTDKYKVEIVVVKTQSGALQATVNYLDGDVKFQNGFDASLVKTAFVGTKRLVGRALGSGMFSFVVRDQAGNVVTSATNQSDGTIRFSEIGFTQPGTYTYTVEEINNGLSGISYDRSVYTVTVVVTKVGDSLSLAVSYPQNGIVFTNTTTPTPGTPTTPGGSSSSSGGGSGIRDTDRFTTISNPTVPLVEPLLEGIFDNGVPLTSLPKTGGDRKSSVINIMIGGALCMTGLLLRRKTGQRRYGATRG